MNEQIRKLFDQALAEFTAENKHVTVVVPDPLQRDFAEKFAELIVRECVDVLKKDMELAHIQLIPLDFKMYANGRLKRMIKEHFGVEE